MLITILLCKASWQSGGRSSTFGVNPVVGSNDEDDEIFEPEKSFPGVFNTFVNYWCVKNRLKRI